jgi:hypothetical protein
MKFIKTCFISLILLCGPFACTDDFEEINTNPNQPEQVPANLLLPRVINLAVNDLALEAWNQGNIVAQLTAKINFTDFDRYLWGSNSDLWNTFYGNMRDVNNILRIAEETNNVNYEATALILRAWMFSILTDNWGDVPYSEATRAKTDNIIQPVYDTQEAIYDGILADLELASSIIDVNGNAIGGDLIYNGDMQKWRKFANSLRIRALMRISNQRDVGSEIQNIIDNQPIFESNDDNALMEYLPTQPNTWPVHTFRVGSFDEYRLSQTIETTLKAFGDPRLFHWFRPTDNPSDDPELFVGMPNGLSENNASNFNGGAANVSRCGPILYEEPNAVDAVIMQYAELQFILAEAAQRGWITGDAQNYYEQGVAASFEYWGVSLPGDYLEREGVSYDNTLGVIMTQKWLASFLVGFEAWYDYRRTGLPRFIQPGPDNVNNDVVPVRFFYPSDQQTLNPDNYAAAVSRQGPDDINTKVWWERD